jgi:hypothetical protein
MMMADDSCPLNFDGSCSLLPRRPMDNLKTSSCSPRTDSPSTESELRVRCRDSVGEEHLMKVARERTSRALMRQRAVNSGLQSLARNNQKAH